MLSITLTRFFRRVTKFPSLRTNGRWCFANVFCTDVKIAQISSSLSNRIGICGHGHLWQVNIGRCASVYLELCPLLPLRISFPDQASFSEANRIARWTEKKHPSTLLQTSKRAAADKETSLYRCFLATLLYLFDWLMIVWSFQQRLSLTPSLFVHGCTSYWWESTNTSSSCAFNSWCNSESRSAIGWNEFPPDLAPSPLQKRRPTPSFSNQKALERNGQFSWGAWVQRNHWHVLSSLRCENPPLFHHKSQVGFWLFLTPINWSIYTSRWVKQLNPKYFMPLARARTKRLMSVWMK